MLEQNVASGARARVHLQQIAENARRTQSQRSIDFKGTTTTAGEGRNSGARLCSMMNVQGGEEATGEAVVRSTIFYVALSQ